MRLVARLPHCPEPRALMFAGELLRVLRPAARKARSCIHEFSIARQAASHGLNVVLADPPTGTAGGDRVLHRVPERHRSLSADDRR
jgi:hypothetical protein